MPTGSKVKVCIRAPFRGSVSSLYSLSHLGGALHHYRLPLYSDPCAPAVVFGSGEVGSGQFGLLSGLL